MNSTDYSDWFQEIVEEALTAPDQRDAIPSLPPPSTPEEGAARLLEALLLMEGFGLPKPDPTPIRYHTLLL